MNKFFNNLMWREPGVKFHPLMHAFLFITLVFGVAYSLDPDVFGLHRSPLYEFSEENLNSKVPELWGAALLLTTALNTVTLGTRWKFIGGFTAMLGFLCWLYASIVYAWVGYPLGLFGIAGPNLFFWTWYYMRVKAYHRAPPKL